MTRGESTSRKLNYGNARIAYTIAGEQERETIVMLHPAFADRHIFEPQIAAFSYNTGLSPWICPGTEIRLRKILA